MYQIKEVILKNGPIEKKRLVITFDDPSQEIVGEFLMSDASMLGFSVLDDLNKVLSGESDVLESTGNRCALKISPDQTVITDLYAEMFVDVESPPAYEISTEELRGLVVMWKERLEKLND